MIEGGENILRKKLPFVYKTLTVKEQDEVTQKLKHNLINAFVSVTLIEAGRKTVLYENLHTTKTIDELIEVLLIMCEGHQQYEACETLKTYLNNTHS